MKSLVIYLLAGTAMLCPMNGNSEESVPSTPPPVKDPKDDFLPDMDFCSMVFQDISSKPIVWNDDRSLAVIYDETASGVLCYTFWCVKRNAQRRMVPIAKYAVWTDFPFTIPQSQISFTQKGNEHLNGAKNDDLEKEWKEFTKKWD